MRNVKRLLAAAVLAAAIFGQTVKAGNMPCITDPPPPAQTTTTEGVDGQTSGAQTSGVDEGEDEGGVGWLIEVAAASVGQVLALF